MKNSLRIKFKHLRLQFFMGSLSVFLASCRSEQTITTSTPDISLKDKNNSPVELFRVKRNDLYGYANKKGEMIIPAIYGNVALNFQEGLAYVWENNGLWGFINHTGDVVIPIQWENVTNFSEGLASVQRNNKMGYIDLSGKVVIPFRYDIAMGFKGGLARVKLNGSWGYIDKKGKEISEKKWKYAFDFENGLGRVESFEGNYGFLNQKGKLVIPCESYKSFDFSEGFAMIYRQGGKNSGFINSSGDCVIVGEWIEQHEKECNDLDGVGKFSEGLTPVVQRRKYGYIDKNGELLINYLWDYAGNFSEGLAVVEKNNKYGFIEKSGEIAIPPQYEIGDNQNNMYSFHNGLALVFINGRKGYIDKQGKLVFWAEDGLSGRKFPLNSQVKAKFTGSGIFNSGEDITVYGVVTSAGKAKSVIRITSIRGASSVLWDDEKHFKGDEMTIPTSYLKLD